MLEVLSILGALLIAAGVLYAAIAMMMPTVCLYTKNYTAAARWLRRYFRHDVALYSPFDLVYLYLVTGRAGEVLAMYRKYQRKGNIGSTFFVEAWVAAHEGEWQVAENALGELRKYTIMNDVDLGKLATAIERKSAKEVDELYLIDMNGRAVVYPSFFRLAWTIIACGAVVVVTWAVLVYFLVSDALLFA